jgi:hypothetical protein
MLDGSWWLVVEALDLVAYFDRIERLVVAVAV